MRGERMRISQMTTDEEQQPEQRGKTAASSSRFSQTAFAIFEGIDS